MVFWSWLVYMLLQYKSVGILNVFYLVDDEICNGLFTPGMMNCNNNKFEFYENREVTIIPTMRNDIAGITLREFFPSG